MQSNEQSFSDFTNCNLNDVQPAKNFPFTDDGISIFWPLYDQYYSSTLHSINESGEHIIDYDDDCKKNLTLKEQKWRFDYQSFLYVSTSNVLTILAGNEQEIISEMLTVLETVRFFDIVLGHLINLPSSKLMRLEKKLYER